MCLCLLSRIRLGVVVCLKSNVHRLKLFQSWQQHERIGHDDPAVVLATPASMRGPWGDCWIFELLTLVSFHNCQTLRKQNISVKPPTHHHDRYVHVPVTVLSQTVKKLHCVTGDRDWILRDSLSETFLMMCRSTSTISL
jgi:hypothetical protein